jgi:hypothetical protein
MVNLLSPELRIRDIRKLVEANLHEVNWERGIDENSEWVLASFENEQYKNRLVSWLKSKNISNTKIAIATDKTWSKLQNTLCIDLLTKPEMIFNKKHSIVVACDRSWVIEYAVEQEVIRFGRWE